MGSGALSEYRLGLRHFLTVQALLWATYAVVHFGASIPAVQENERAMLALMQFVRALAGFAITSVGWRLMLRPRHPGSAKWWMIQLLIAGVMAFVWMFLDRAALMAVAPLAGGVVPWHAVPRGLDLEYLFVMLAWTGGFAGVILNRHALSVEADARVARSNAVLAQLNPHFLFNALNMLRSLIAEDADAAREMVTRISGLLRRVIATDATRTVPLSDELGFVRDYLEIQRARFGDSVQVSWNVDDEAAKVHVPALLLQPIIENTFKHGTPDAAGVRTISVECLMNNGAEIRIANSGTLLPNSTTLSPNSGTLSSGRGEEGVGLDLTRRRLEQHYGDAQSLTLTERDGSVIVTVHIPAARP